MVMLLLLAPFTAIVGGLPGSGEDPYPDPEIMGEDNITIDPSPNAVIHPRTSITHARGFISNPSGDLTKTEIENGAWIKKIGNDGEIYLEYDDNGTVHKFTISLIDFKGNTKINKPPKEVKNTKIPSNSTIHGYIDDIPVTVRWTEHPFTTKEEVIWNSTILKSVSYELKIQSKNITIDTTTLEFLHDGDHIGVSLDTPIIIDSGKLLDIPLDWSLSRAKDKDKAKDKYWTLDINWTYPTGSSAPYVLDPTISFNGTTFKIEDGKLEVKTYQELWGIYMSTGTNVRYNDGYCAIDIDGDDRNVGLRKLPSPALDLSDMTDFTIDVRTTNGDADWSLKIYITDDESGTFQRYNRYTKNLANDVDATYNISDFIVAEYGTVDMSAIDYMLVYFVAIDTALAANVICEIKDFKFTIPVKTSDLYDSTGRGVLYDEDFEGDDGLKPDEYNPDLTFTAPGGSIVELDDTQYHSGSSSMKIFTTSSNWPDIQEGAAFDIKFGTVEFWLRYDTLGTRVNFYLSDGIATLGKMSNQNTGNFFLYYGNGGGGDNVVSVGPFAADIWHKIRFDIDCTTNKCRYWINDVTYPGPNANAGGWDNFSGDATATACITWNVMVNQVSSGNADIWIDDIKAYVGFEDFSALSSPHDVDNISESLTPTGTDYSRNKWDGEWGIGAGLSTTQATDDTNYVIGSKSIKYTNPVAAQIHGGMYTFDDVQDVLSETRMRLYLKLSDQTNMDYVRIHILKGGITGDNDAYFTITPSTDLVEDKWNYLDLDLSAFFEEASYDPTDVKTLVIETHSTNDQTVVINIDAVHFYGDPVSGLCYQGNSIDINGTEFIQDLGIYDLNQLHDTSDSDGNWTAVMDTGVDNRTIEFSDVPNAGIGSSINTSTINLTGYDENNHITWTSVGNIDPTNHWDGDPPDGLNFILSNVTWKYCYEPIFSEENDITANHFSILNSDVAPQFHGGNHSVHGLIVRDAGHADTSLFTRGNHTFTEADIDGEKSRNIHQNTSGVLAFIDSIFHEDYHYLGEENATLVSKNHNNTPDYLMSTHTLEDISDIPEIGRWGDGANIWVLNGTINIDMNATLTNGSWTKDAIAGVMIFNNTSMNMVNSTFVISEFAINETGYLVESNFTGVSFVMTGTLLTATVDNSTSSNWVAYHNSWDGSGSIVQQPVTWGYNWGDGTSSSSTGRNQAHNFWSAGEFRVTVETTLLNGDNSSMEFLAGLIKIYANFTVVRTGGYYEFTDTSETNNTTIVSWSWNFGDGSTSTQQNPGHRYLYEGEYIVNLTVIDNETNTDEMLVSIEVSIEASIPFSEQITYVIVPIIMSIVVLVIILVVMFKVVLRSVENTIRRVS